jgi:GNAT superfamily N-acetyltransferase
VAVNASRSSYAIRRLAPGESAVCERMLRDLPQWFGIEEALVSYVRDTETMETWMACAGDAGPVGFVTLRRHNEHSAEIQVMAVSPAWHRRGVGRALVKHAESVLCERGVDFLQVKTLGPSRPNEHYARTREFYRSMGFVPLEENRLWGEVNPCLILVKHLECAID